MSYKSRERWLKQYFQFPRGSSCTQRACSACPVPLLSIPQRIIKRFEIVVEQARIIVFQFPRGLSSLDELKGKPRVEFSFNSLEDYRKELFNLASLLAYAKNFQFPRGLSHSMENTQLVWNTDFPFNSLEDYHVAVVGVRCYHSIVLSIPQRIIYIAMGYNWLVGLIHFQFPRGLSGCSKRTA